MEAFRLFLKKKVVMKSIKAILFEAMVLFVKGRVSYLGRPAVS